MLTESEARDALVIADATLVVLPLLPNLPMGPYNALNLHAIWVVLVLVLVIGAAGHVVVRALGARYGLPLAGLASGFISSTATIGAMGARARKLRWPCFCSVWHLGQCTTRKSIRVTSMANQADH